MKKLVFGSLNIDRTYSLDHFVQAGETQSAEKMELFCGGKGFNQAVALARAGSRVSFAGAVGDDGDFLLAPLEAEGIGTCYIKRVPGASGHAVIQVDKSGGNCIFILAGANGEIHREDVDRVLADFEAGDFILLQNEISSLNYILTRAHEKGMLVALNPSPFNEAAARCDLSLVDYLVINEVEGAAISGREDWRGILEELHGRWPQLNLVLTLGHRGSVYMDRNAAVETCGIYKVRAVDSTAAGDTFTGFFFARLLDGAAPKEALRAAAIASGISVSRSGAAPSIPRAAELGAFGGTALQPFEG